MVTEGELLDVIVIGGGQSALTVAYFLKRAKLSFLLLDAEEAAGGAWRHGWDSLTLFSPSAWSTIAGWPMPPVTEGNPDRDHVVSYLEQYEARYGFSIVRPVSVTSVERTGRGLRVRSKDRDWEARVVISATGTWSNPYVPAYPGIELFQGQQIHSAHYQSPEAFQGKRVLVVGGGNSGAQIYAELSEVADATWVTTEEPAFLPDDVDGRVLFERALAQFACYLVADRDRPGASPPPQSADGFTASIAVIYDCQLSTHSCPSCGAAARVGRVGRLPCTIAVQSGFYNRSIVVYKAS